MPYPGKPSCSAGRYGRRKPNRKGRSPSGEGAEGGRSADRTDDSGPVKPGNSVEDKTLTTEKQGSKDQCPAPRFRENSSTQENALWVRKVADERRG